MNEIFDYLKNSKLYKVVLVTSTKFVKTSKEIALYADTTREQSKEDIENYFLHLQRTTPGGAKILVDEVVSIEELDEKEVLEKYRTHCM